MAKMASLHGCEPWTGGGTNLADIPGRHTLEVAAYTYIAPRPGAKSASKMLAIKHLFRGGANDGKEFIRRFAVEGSDPEKTKSALNFLYGYLTAIGCEFGTNPRKANTKQVPKVESIIGKRFSVDMTTNTYTSAKGQERKGYDFETSTIQLEGAEGTEEQPATVDFDEPDLG